MNSVRPNRRVCACIESLEQRTLLTAALAGLDGSFGQGGVLAGQEILFAQQDGKLVSRSSNGALSLLNPDGTFSSKYTAAPPAPPAQNVQADGKYITLSNGVLRRFNRDGSLDSTFGQNGAVSDFVSGSGLDAFQPAGVVFNSGEDVIVVGGEARF